tara:strand:+ start:3812 stop:4582 length:771 start_codon:yes stop_codon:yes gene_type:complete
MIWKKALKYPILIIGVVWMAIYLSDAKTADFWTRFKYRFYPAAYVCDSIKSRITDKLESNWSLHCPHTTFLLARINGEDELLKVLENQGSQDPYTELRNLDLMRYRKILYSRVFDSIIKLITVADQDTLESLKEVKLNYKTSRLGVLVQSDGQALRTIRDKIYLVKVQRLHHRATVALKDLGKEPQFNSSIKGKFSAPINIDEELWNKTLETERSKLVQINLKRFIGELKDKTSQARTLLKVKEYTKTDTPPGTSL